MSDILTPAERAAIARLADRGLTDEEIAARLNLSVSTVLTHAKRRRELVAFEREVEARHG